MKHFLFIVYIKLYEFAKFCSKDDLYEYTAMFLLALLLSFNLLTVIGFYNRVVNHQSIIFPSKILILIVGFSVVCVVYFAFVFRGKYLEMNEKYKTEKRINNTSGTVITISYTVVSLLLFFGLGWLKLK